MDQDEWLKRAAASDDDDRPVLRRVHYEKDLAIATDGMTLHVMKAKEYPDWRKPLNDIDPNNGIYVIVDPERLIKSLQGMTRAILHVSGPESPIEISGKDYTDNLYAVVMPLAPAKGKSPEDDFWRPSPTPED